MKRNLYLAAMTLIIAIIASSCQPEPVVTHPEDITGYWEASSGDVKKWYGLDITDMQHATFITYYAQDDPVELSMNLTYDATIGKGHLSGERVIPLRATTDSTIALTLEEGTVIFYRGVRPKPVINLAGLWKSNRFNNMGVDILIYPKDSKGTTNVTVIEADDAASFQLSSMGTLTSFNQETGNAFITSELYTGKINVITSIDPYTLTLTDSDEMYVLTRQTKVVDAPTDLIGTWTASIPGLLSITVEAAKDHTCMIDYAMVDPTTMTPVTGSIKGFGYYCPAATMGAVHLQEIDKHPEWAMLIGEYACGLFRVTSETTATTSFRGMDIIFQKK